MQEAISLDTHLSWTVYLQTGRRDGGGEREPWVPCWAPAGMGCWDVLWT